MAIWPRVDVELVEDYFAESPWKSRRFLRIHTDVPLDERTAVQVKEAMDRGKVRGDFSEVLTILSSRPPVSEDLRKYDPETQRTWATLGAALTLPQGDTSQPST